MLRKNFRLRNVPQSFSHLTRLERKREKHPVNIHREWKLTKSPLNIPPTFFLIFQLSTNPQLSTLNSQLFSQPFIVQFRIPFDYNLIARFLREDLSLHTQPEIISTNTFRLTLLSFHKGQGRDIAPLL